REHRAVAESAIDEGDTVEIETDGLASRAGTPLRDRKNDVEAFDRIDAADHRGNEQEWHDQRQGDVAEHLPHARAVDLRTFVRLDRDRRNAAEHDQHDEGGSIARSRPARARGSRLPDEIPKAAAATPPAKADN